MSYLAVIRLFRQVLDGFQCFQRVIGVVHGLRLHVDQPVHHRPEVQAVVECFSDGFELSLHSQLFSGDDVEARITSADVVGDG